jgi:hypothetical protein
MVFRKYPIGGICGSTTDAASGSAIQYNPSQFYITLWPVGKEPPKITQPDKKPDAKNFIITNYSNILHELASGSGEYMESLFVLLGVQAGNKDDATKKIKEISESEKNIPDFAEKVVSSFLI